MKNGTGKEYNREYCIQTYLDKGHLVSHITIQHKKCTLCDNIFPSEQDLETHMKAVHKRDKSKNYLPDNQVLKITRTKNISRRK